MKFICDDDYMIRFSRNSWDWGKLFDTSSTRFVLSHTERQLYTHCKLVKSDDLAICNEYVGSLVEPHVPTISPKISKQDILLEGLSMVVGISQSDSFYTTKDCFFMQRAMKRAIEWALTHCKAKDSIYDDSLLKKTYINFDSIIEDKGITEELKTESLTNIQEHHKKSPVKDIKKRKYKKKGKSTRTRLYNKVNSRKNKTSVDDYNKYISKLIEDQENLISTTTKDEDGVITEHIYLK